MAYAPYEVNITGSDDETFLFSVAFEMTDGSEFPFEDHEIEYVVAKDGCEILRMTEGNGITIQESTVTFRAARGTLCVGEYQHGCRVRRLDSGDETQVFEGTIRIGEGHFGSAPAA